MSAIKTKMLLRETIRMIIESPASDAFELSVAKSIDSQFKSSGIRAKKAGATSLPDVLVTAKDVGNSFIEVKMSHTDNLANPRVFYDGSKWASTYKTPVAKYAVELLNSSDQSRAFLDELSKFLKRDNFTLPTTRSGLKDPNAVSLKDMVGFVTKKGSRYIVSEPDVNVGELVTLHYTVGKASAAHYLQAKDDFYLIGSEDVLGLTAANVGNPPIPVLGGSGDFRVRVSTRREFYEIQIELKIKHYSPLSSPYSVLKGTRKINPFTALAEKLEAGSPSKTSVNIVKKKSSTATAPHVGTKPKK